MILIMTTPPMTSFDNWKGYFSDSLVFLWFLSITLYLSLQRSFPYIFDDEYGVLGAGAVFAGLDWTTPSSIPFYGFLLSLITFPVYWLDLEPTITYRLILAANAVLVATSALLAVRTLRLLFDQQTEAIRIGIIIAAFSYPAVLHFSAMAMAETTLLFCFFLITYHLASILSSTRPRMLNAVLLGIGIGLAQYAHPRGIAFVIASTLVILYSMRTGAISRKLLIAIAVSAIASIQLLALLKKYLFATFYANEHISSSLLSFLESRLLLMTLHDAIKFILVSFGQLTYLITSSFGLLVSALCILFFVSWNYFQRREAGLGVNSAQINNDAVGLVSNFVLASFLVMFAASTVFLVNGQRADHVFYGRYNEVMAPAIIIVALVFLTRLSKKAALLWFLTGAFLAIFSLLVVNLYPPQVFQRPTIWLNVTSWFVYSYEAWRIDPKILLYGLVLAFFVLHASLAISKKLLIFVFIAFFTSAALFNFEKRHLDSDISWVGFNDLSVKFNQDMTGMKLQASGAGWPTKNKGEALQFAFPKASVSFKEGDLKRADAVLDYGDAYCTEENTVARVEKANFCITSKKLQNRINLTPAHFEQNAQTKISTAVANIAYSDEIASKGIEFGTLSRVCSLISNSFYTRWFRYCLPTIDLTITQKGLSGDENQELGFYITNSDGKWLTQWRIDIDNDRLAREGTLELGSRIQVPVGIHKDVYWLNISIFDASGWDQRSFKRIELRPE